MFGRKKIKELTAKLDYMHDKCNSLEGVERAAAKLIENQKILVKALEEKIEILELELAEIKEVACAYDAKLIEANNLICELCEKCGEDVCKNGEECDWKMGEDR